MNTFTLAQVVKQLEALDEDATIVARRPWTAASEARVIHFDAGRIPIDVQREGFVYFLEVFIAREFLEGLDSSAPSPDDRLARLIYYAEYDA